MFAVIISEKGGAERRQVFDQSEVNVGRVQGNDLMLPKGNVSKRHAKLVYKDGRYIVTDNKSTNGTYVNGRKIAQATIVREGDKIYIGDFVLRIEQAAAVADSEVSEPPPPGLAAPPLLAGGREALPSDGAIDVDADVSHSSSGSSGGGLELSRPSDAVRIDDSRPRVDLAKPSDIVSHFPLEHDPDEAPAIPAPPRVPAGPPGVSKTAMFGSSAAKPPPLVAKSSGSEAKATVESAGLVRPDSPGPGHVMNGGAAPSGLGAPSASPSGLGAPSAAPSGLGAPSPRRAAESRESRARRDSPEVLAARNALATVVERAGAASGDAHALAAALDAAVAGLRSEGKLPAEVDAGLLVEHARREIAELGPLGPLLGDDEVLEIQIPRFDHVIGLTARKAAPAEVGFSTEESLLRAVRKLVESSGAPLDPRERFVERRLAGGVLLSGLLGERPGERSAFSLRKPKQCDQTVDDLVRSGAVSRAMAILFGLLGPARANVLVTGSAGPGVAVVAGALAAAGGEAERVVVLHDEEELALDHPSVLSLRVPEDGEEAARAVRAAARLRPDRLLVNGISGRPLAELVDTIGSGLDGVVAISRAPTARHALARLPADLAAQRPGLGVEGARELVAGSFDLVIEVARLRDGRHRVARIAEVAVEGGKLVGKDVFTFAVERTAAGGAVEGSFHASGHIPAIVEDAVSRGVSVDTSLFRRAR